jgi:integrase
MAAKRGPGEGSIYQRGNGRWISYVRLPDGRKKFFTGATRQVVRQKLTAALEAQRQGALVTARMESVEAYLRRWLVAIEPSLRPSTFRAYELCLSRISRLIGRTKLQALEPPTLQGAYATLLRRGLSPSTVRQTHVVLHGALRQAVRWNLLVRNPTDAVSPPRVPRHEMATLTEDEVRRLFEVTRGDRLHPLWVLLATTGLRSGEALGLKWSDVDLDTGTLTITRALQYQRGRGYVFVEPKTSRSRRSVPLPAGTVQVLIAHRRRQAEERILAGPDWRALDLVFCRSLGQPLDRSELSTRLHKITDAAGLPRVRVHDLRHTAATHLLTKKVHPKIVQDLLGHSTITLTLDTYSHVIPSLTREASRHMDDYFSVGGVSAGR